MEYQEEIDVLKNKKLDQAELKSLCDTAIAFFQQEKYEDAMQLFILLHQNNFACDEIMQMIMECYYEPNMDKLSECYLRNITQLERYPYIMVKQFPQFEELEMKMIPITDEQYIIYHTKKGKFGDVYQVEKEKDDRPFFQDIEKQLLIKNEVNPWNIKYLWDNVRRSEDYGGDNHIYLYYDTVEEFCAYLQVMDITKYLMDEKLVFIFGEEQMKEYYPLDFKKLFGIDYAKMELQPIRIEEIKRIFIFQPMTLASGISFYQEIMDFHPDLLTIGGTLARPIFQIFPCLYEIILKCRSTYEILEFLKKPSCNISKCLEGKDSLYDTVNIKALEYFLLNEKNILKRTVKILKGIKMPSKSLWLKAFFLAYAFEHKREFKSRISPAIHFIPHWPRYIIYWSLDVLSSFEYFVITSIVRYNTVQMGGDFYDHNISARITHGMQILKEKIINFYDLLEQETRMRSSLEALGCLTYDDFMDRHIKMIRFEDLKLQPKATLTSLCEFIDIPVRDTLFQCTLDGKNFRENDGFGHAPVYRVRKDLINDYDHYRVELLSMGIYQHWGYKYKYYNGAKYEKEEILQMCTIPFQIESIEKEREEYVEEFHNQKRIEFLQTVYWWLSDEIQGQIKQMKPIQWLKPKPELVEGELYE